MILSQSATQPYQLAQSNPESLSTVKSQIQTSQQKAEETRRIRRLQLMVDVAMQMIQRSEALRVEQASQLVADVRSAALVAFPDKAQAFDLLFWPRLQRTMRQRYRMQ